MITNQLHRWLPYAVHLGSAGTRSEYNVRAWAVNHLPGTVSTKADICISMVDPCPVSLTERLANARDPMSIIMLAVLAYESPMLLRKRNQGAPRCG